MKLLDGQEIAGFIKARQAKVLKFAPAKDRRLTLAIIGSKQNQVIQTYISLKKRWAEDIGVQTLIYSPPTNEIEALIKKLNQNQKVSGIVLQLPLDDPTPTDKLCQLIDPKKDVDGLNPQSHFDGATVTAINWLLVGYNIDLKGKELVIIGQGRLVGQPLADDWQQAGFRVITMDKTNFSWQTVVRADVIVTATGQPKLIKSQYLKPNAIVVDAGTCSQAGQLLGDVDPAVYQTRPDLTITPQKGGLGPLTVAALFENLINTLPTQKITPKSSTYE